MAQDKRIPELKKRLKESGFTAEEIKVIVDNFEKNQKK